MGNTSVDRVFIRNYLLFLFALTLCAGTLVYTLVSGNQTIDKVDDGVSRAHDVIVSAEQISTFVEGMLAAQRGYIITGQDDFLEDYDTQKLGLSEKIARISELTIDNPSQTSRVDEMRNYKTQLTEKLEERAAKYKPVPNVTPVFLDGVESVNNLKESIIQLNRAVLEEEYRHLDQRIKEVDNQKARYFNFLLIGVIVSSALLLLFNGVLLRSQRRRIQAESRLEDTEKRFALALEGTRDGIYDWNLVTGEVFYSARFFNMLGYDRHSFTGTPEDFRDLLHPEDAPRIWKSFEDYFSNRLPEYSSEFRLRRADGQWAWIHSRAQSIRDDKGKPLRVVGAHTDISFAKERQEKLEQEKKAAEDANRAKSDFLAHMSHEIRTPLTAISGIVEIFRGKQDNLDDRQKKLLHTLHSSTSALKDLVNDVLDFSKIESQELELSQEDFHLAKLFEEIISMMSLRANEKAVSFVFNYDGLSGAVFHGDRARIRQILINLIGNAIKFTDEGGVTIKAGIESRAEKPFLRIDVADTGIGIAPEHFDLVFERFKQADPGVSRKYGGTGLGLPISKNLAELMGGRIILSSQTGKGATFSLLLPDTTGRLESGYEPAVPTGGKAGQNPSISSGGRVLVVEDYEANVTVLSFILDDLGCAYDVARNGQDALELWEKNTYNLILMDVQMPIMDGFSATLKIRSAEQERSRPRTPVVGMTAHALVGDKDKCIAVGMDAYLPKPIIESDLRREIFRYIGHESLAA